MLQHAQPAQVRAWLNVVNRHLARERNKGRASHWSYSLNKHIALKGARDRLRGMLEGKGCAGTDNAPVRRQATAAPQGGRRLR